MVYVDPLFQMESSNPQAYRVGERHDHHWCHLFADEPDCSELHALAQQIGLRRSWFQGDHYDVTPVMRDRAIRAGARPVTITEAVMVWRGYAQIPCGCEAVRLRRPMSRTRVNGVIHMRYGCVTLPPLGDLPPLGEMESPEMALV